MNVTFGDLIKFILENKTDKVFIGDTELQIAQKIYDAANDKTLYYSQDEHNNITGMILAEKIEERKVIFVTENLAMNIGNLIQFAKKAKEQFKDYHLEWLKRGIYKHHNTKQFYKKLSV